MRFNIYCFAFLIGVILSVSSCSNDFKLTEGQVEIPIVYGLISVEDTANYIRVERAFVDEATSAFILAKDVNLLYFKNLKVELVHSKTGKRRILKMVDGNLEGYPRAKGAFADAPNYLYKDVSKEPLIPNDEYALVLTKEDGVVLSEAKCTALKPYSLGEISPTDNTRLSFGYNSNSTIVLRDNPNAVIHDLSFVINIQEVKDGIKKDTSLVWHVVKNLDEDRYNFKGRAFYEFINSALKSDPSIRREFITADLVVVSGSKELKSYIDIARANLGITSSGEIPLYSNLSNGGQGIFSSITKYVGKNMTLAPQSLDSLRNGVITKSLNFR